MRAIVLTEAKGPEGLKLEEHPTPVPKPEEIQVRVRGTALNRADLLQTLGLYPVPKDAPLDIPGLEYAGEVSQVGTRVSRFRVGDPVMGIVGGGAFAEYLVCHEKEALPIPSNISMEQAAAFPEAFLTAFDALCLQGKLHSGEWVLISAAGSGVGTAACQIAKAEGAKVIGTVRTAEKLERLHSLGMDHGVVTATSSGSKTSADPEETLPDDPTEGLADTVRRITEGHGVDLVLDLVGGKGLNETLRTLALRGRLLLVGMLGGRTAELDLTLLLRQRITLIGTVLRSRPLEEKIALAQEAERRLLPHLAAGRIRPVIDSVFPLEKITQAFERLSSNASFGKVVIHVL